MNGWGTFDPQPVLTGDTVSLRPTVATDWDGSFAAASDPLVWAVHPAHDRWQEPVFRQYFDQALAGGGGLTFIDRASGLIIGASRYDRQRAGPGEIEIGWTFLSRNRWGGATNREIKTLMIGHALRSFDSAIFYVGEGNIRSRRAMEKIGGVLLPEREANFDMAGVVTSHVVYAIYKPLG